MACPRCGGFLVVEGFTDMESTLISFDASRCLNCGHIEDTVMVVNRRRDTPTAQLAPVGTTMRRSSARLRAPQRIG